MGVRTVSLRGDGPWRGVSTRSTVERGDRRQIKLQNGYVSGDGHEIRPMPGWKTLWDGSEVNNADGYTRTVLDLFLPVLSSPIGSYNYLDAGSDSRDLLTLSCWSRPTHLHGFAQIRGRLEVWGESDFRKIPLYADGDRTNAVTIDTVETISSSFANQWRLTLSASAINMAYGSRDFGTSGSTPLPGWHGLQIHDVVWVEGVTVANAADQALIDARLNNRFHRVSLAGTTVTLSSGATGALSGAVSASAGEIYRTRANRSDLYPTPGLTPYEADFYDRIDDPDALTVWTVTEALTTDSVTKECHPAWVANRQRDMGDNRTQQFREGPSLNADANNMRTISRRRQKRLPYRLNPALGGDRIILAAPRYGCLFQVPMGLPRTGSGWPATDSAWSGDEGLGVLHPGNDLHDKPRALGLPKAQLIESTFTSPPNTGLTLPYNFMVYQTSSSTQTWPAGTYRLAISYEDEYTGEEGLACEPVTIEVPAEHTNPDRGYGIQVVYMHPGYVFPETLAFKLNVYLGVGATAPLGYFVSIPLQDSIGSDESRLTAKYGFTTTTPFVTPSAVQMFRTYQLILPINTSPLADAVDTTRLAPVARDMPRGAEAAAFIRGRLFTVGHSGTHGGRQELRRTFLSDQYNESAGVFTKVDELTNRAFRSAVVMQSTPGAGDAEDGPFGIGSNYLPSAYQQTEIWSFRLFAHPKQRNTIIRVRNNASHNTSGAIARDPALFQRLEMSEDPYDADIGDIGSPLPVERGHIECYHIQPRGQVQASEVGKPDVALDTQVQFMDPSKDDDGIAVGHYGGQVVLCSRRETFMLAYRTDPQGESAQLISNEHGCIATNSMVEFDGGLAWIGERGPVAMAGGAPRWVSDDLEHDFVGSRRRYLRDSQGLMRHCISAHDKARGLVLWGLVSEDATHTVTWDNVSYAFDAAPDEARSRFPCDEILVWSYIANSWSTWRMPAGLEVLWMAPVVDSAGDERMAFLAADGRIYVWDDEYHDTNTRVLQHLFTSGASGTTVNPNTFTFGVDSVGGFGATARGSNDTLLRVGMRVVLIDANGKFKAETTIAALDFLTQIVTLADSLTWERNDLLCFGLRPEMTLQTTYVGSGADVIDNEAIHLRYWMPWGGVNLSHCWARVDMLKTDFDNIAPKRVGATQNPEYEHLGYPVTGDRRVAHRRQLTQGRPITSEMSIELRVSGLASVRITDVTLEPA